MRPFLLAGVAAFLAAVTNASVAMSADPEPCSLPDPGDRFHNGFFARSDTGLSFLWASVRGPNGSSGRSAIRGWGQSAVISVGGTPWRGLVLGGTVWTAQIDPTFVEGGKTVVPDDNSVKETLLRVGPFVDWYPNPARGFHAQAAALFAVQIESDVKGNPIKPASLGAALSVGAGYEWFVSSEFSVGLLGRLAVGRIVRAPSDGDEVMLFAIPELSLTATYH